MPIRLLVVVCLLFPALASARTIRIDTPVQSDFRAVSRDMGAALSFKPLNPTAPLGVLGFHVDVMASYTGIENKGAWRRMTGRSFDELGMIALSAGKGLIGGLDVGAFYAEIPDTNVELLGGEVRYAIAEGGLISPAIGLRAAYTRVEGLDDFSFDTKSLDLSISKGLPLFTPYAGIGRVWSEADPDGRFGLRSETLNQSKIYGGVRLSLLLLKIVLEADNTGDSSSFNLRAGIGF